MMEKIRRSALWSLVQPLKQVYKDIAEFRQYRRIYGYRRAYAGSFGRKKVQRALVASLFPDEDTRQKYREDSKNWGTQFSIVVPLYNSNLTYLREMISSVQAQVFQNWQLCLVDASDAEHDEVGRISRQYAKEDGRICYQKLSVNGGISENTNAALAMATGEYIVFLDHDDLLAPMALYENAKRIRQSGADFLYSDELVFEGNNINKVAAVHSKPDFAREDLYALNYICHLCVVKRTLVDKVGGLRKEFDGSQDHDFVLRATEQAERIEHIAKVLYLWRSHKTSVAQGIHRKNFAAEAGLTAVRESLKRSNRNARVEATEIFPTVYRVFYETNLRTEAQVETILLDASKDNWCRACNKAAENSSKPYLLFALHAASIPEESKIKELLSYAMQPEIGAVGGMLVNKRGEVVQNGRILINNDKLPIIASDAGASQKQHSYIRRLSYARQVSAVSMQCMLIAKSKYLEVGGVDERFAGEKTPYYADADFCLKLQEKGYQNIVDPYVCVTADTAVQKPSVSMSELFMQKWKNVLVRGDAHYNAQCSEEIAWMI